MWFLQMNFLLSPYFLVWKWLVDTQMLVSTVAKIHNSWFCQLIVTTLSPWFGTTYNKTMVIKQNHGCKTKPWLYLPWFGTTYNEDPSRRCRFLWTFCSDHIFLDSFPPPSDGSSSVKQCVMENVTTRNFLKWFSRYWFSANESKFTQLKNVIILFEAWHL